MRADFKQSFHTGWALGIILGISLLVHVGSLVFGSTVLAGWHCVHQPVHVAIEMAGAIIAFGVARLLMTLHRRGEGTSFNVVIAGALVGMGVLDGLHSLVQAGNTFVFLHSFASFVGGLLFALVWLPSRWTSKGMNWWPWAVLTVVSAVGVISMAEPGWVPVMVRDGVFTRAAEFLNVAGGLLMFAAAARLVLKYHTTRKVDDVLFCLHCGLFGAAAVMFEQPTLWDFAWWGWHVLQLMAYGVALWFMILSDERTVQKLLNNARRQNERQQQLIKAERQLREAKLKAEEASLAKSQFLASMSHELRTPLNGVIGMTELLSGTQLTPKQRQFIDACRNSGEALLQLINDILDFTKIEAGKLELDLHDFDLEKLVTDTVDTMSWRATEKALEMPCYVDQMSRLVLKGDSNRLRQVLVNLLGNAIKFTEAGEVAIRTEIVDRLNDRLTVRFSISDTGIGIPADKRERLFQSFSQVDASTTRNYGGTGLGLVISHSLVELMGGTIGLDSEAGKGSTFWFEVPFALVDESSEVVSGQLQLAGLRALIVDDNETNRMILTEYTSGWGLASITTASVDEALAAVDRALSDGSPFHIVLTDYNMPQRDGLDLARALKDHPQLTVLLGSTDIYLNPGQLREHGIDAILRKPLRRHELYDILCGVFASSDTLTRLTGNKPRAVNEETHLSGHILLAEDNSINQMYMVEMMKQLGCTCDTVSNGREAIVAVKQTKYDLVLMDCQMPEMDGLEATRRIREMEADGTLDGHLPIIALTANAVKGDRERCLEAGMDQYLSKPVQKEQVASMFARFLGDAEEPATKATVARNDEQADGQPAAAPIDAESLLARCFGNLEFAGSLLDELESTGLKRVEEIRQQAEQHNAEGTAEAAHALKGATGILCAESLHQLSAEIEQAGRSSNLDHIEAMIRDLSVEMQRCLDGLPRLRAEIQLVKQRAE